MLKPILLVEDDHRDLELTVIALEQSQLANQVVIARDGVEALDYLRRTGAYASRTSEHPAIVLLDLKLPKIDGLEVLEQMQASDELRTIPTVVLTTSSEEPDLTRARSLGARSFVEKPVRFADFVDALRTLGVFWAITDQPPAGSAN